MLELSNNLLESSLSHALEVMAFICGNPAQTSAMAQGPMLSTKIRYGGAIAGGIELICPARLGAILVSNLLGIAEDSAEAVSRAPDALGELANITCGAMLKSLVDGRAAIVEMGTPVQSVFDPRQWPALAEGWSFFEAEGCLIACSHMSDERFDEQDSSFRP